MVFKLPILRYAEAPALSGARLFDPSDRGRLMREWVEVPAEQASRWLELAWEAFQYYECFPTYRCAIIMKRAER